VDVFNAAYQRKVSAPALTKPARVHLKAIREAYGEDGLCCLPILAWLHDETKGHNPKHRAPTHLLHDGSRATFNWATLLEQAEAHDKHSPDLKRAWRIAKDHGLTEALERLGFPAYDSLEMSGPVSDPVVSIEERMKQLRQERANG